MSEQYNTRLAKHSEIKKLDALMRQSLSVWGYSEEALDMLMDKLSITTEMISKSIVYVAELKNEIKGFWCVEPIEGLGEDRFYIDPTFIKTGIGTLLWDKMLAELRGKGINYFTFVSDANAQGFYEKKGAIKIGAQPSVLIGENDVPIMRYYLK
ncbi:MAG: GNAT family N-acetyltransferase [Rickettsiaceae bacterium]|nr:GNAT family N-acetyltransferase [Rickettsiaceae bacterium]MDP5021319.1 GNAT family N-acetyltransferase [Rickettsiaceae bacterium]MDP5083339.1 GNAT family N-acetyltransferase [Rickettsiaceae bacterium]